MCWHHAWIQELCWFSVNTWRTTLYPLQSLCQKYNLLCYRFDHIKEISCLVDTDSSPNVIYRLSCVCSQCSQQCQEKKKSDRHADRKCVLFCIFIFFHFIRSNPCPENSMCSHKYQDHFYVTIITEPKGHWDVEIACTGTISLSVLVNIGTYMYKV